MSVGVAPTDRSRSDCVREQVAKLDPVSRAAEMDCECLLYPEPRSNGGRAIEIDIGIKAFCSDSNGNAVLNLRYLECQMGKLIREQHRLFRK